jgi:hypothetical protein
MNRMARKWSAGVVLASALCAVAVNVGRGDDDHEDAKALRKAIDAAGKEVLKNLNGIGATAAAKLAKEHKMEATMRLFQMQSKGGLGIGDLTKAGHKNSIDLLIADYSTTKPPTKDEVKKYAGDLIKVAQITAVIAEMTPTWGPAKAQGMKTPEKWNELTAEMKQGSADLISAAKAQDEKAVLAAAKRMKNSCAVCHKIFRTDK